MATGENTAVGGECLHTGPNSAELEGDDSSLSLLQTSIPGNQGLIRTRVSAGGPRMLLNHQTPSTSRPVDCPPGLGSLRLAFDKLQVALESGRARARVASCRLGPILGPGPSHRFPSLPFP